MYAHILKANPYRDEFGKFAKATGAHSIVDKDLRSNEAVVAIIKKRLSPKELATIAGYEEKIKGKPTTADLHRDANGNWSPERQKLHAKILKKFFADEAKYTAKKGELPSMVTLGGRGGSGKSKFTDGTLGEVEQGKHKVIDPDAIKAQFKGYDGTNAALFHEESGHVADIILAKAVQKRMHLLQDVTMRSEKTVKEALDFAKAHGYDLEGHYMNLPREEAGFRAAKRGLKETEPRYVPLDIVAGNTHNERNFNTLKPYFSKWSMYSNDVPTGEKPKLLSRSKE